MKRKTKVKGKTTGKKQVKAFTEFMKTGKVKAPRHAHISMVLDRSGSMAGVAAATISGVNAFLSEQKKAAGRATITLAQFDDLYEIVYADKEIADAPDLTSATFSPRGSTALLDAIGDTIAATDKVKGAKIVFVIVTDGMENASTKFTQKDIFASIKARRAKKWEFVFIGANQDAIQAGGALGIAGANNMTYGANALGTQSMFASVSANTTSLRTGSKIDMSFEDKDREAQMKAGVGLTKAPS